MATVPNLSMSKAQLACVAVEAYLYGLYSVLAALTVWLLFTRRKMDLTTITLVIHTIVMFGICTGHVCVILEYILTIFLYHNAATEGDVINGHDGRFVAFLVMLFLNCMIGDLVVIWRVWVIWARGWKAVMAPIFFWVASIVALCGSGYVISHPGTVQYADALAVSPWIASFMGFTLATNFTAVSAISYRYWLYQREVTKLGDQTTRSGNSSVSPIMVLIIESGSLYCVTWIVVLAAYASSSRTLDIVLLALVAQFTAMYPTLIVVLVCLRITQRDRMDRLHGSTIQFSQASRTSCATCGQKSWRSNRLRRTHAVEVRVEALTQTDIELLPVNAKQDDSKHDNVSQKAEEDSIEVC